MSLRSTAEPSPLFMRKNGMSTVDVREHNASQLLREIWREERVSRADLARTTGLSASTVSAHVKELLDTGLVVETQEARSTGGRPATLLRFQDDHRYLVGVEMGASHLSVVITNLRGVVKESRRVDFDVQGDPNGTLERIARLVDASLAAMALGLDRVVGIGLGVPCPVDLEDPDVLSQRILAAWVDTRPATWLRERFGLPVMLENDANCGATAEHWWGSAKEIGTFAYIKVSTGVGAGLFLDGRIYRGAGGVAGEIGHTAVVLEGGARCRCGLTGCLEAHIGRDALQRQAERELRAGAPSRLAVDRLDERTLIDAARHGDPVALRAVEGAGHMLGVAISNLLNLYNPRMVVLGGRLPTAGDVFFRPLRKAILDRTLWNSMSDVEVIPTLLAEEAIAVGAATLVLQQALDTPTWLTRASP